MTRIAVMACIVLLGVGAGDAAAHDLRPGVLTLVETGRGEYDLRFVAPIDSRGDVVDVTVHLDRAGHLTVRGMRGDAMRTVVRLERRNGAQAEWLVSAASPTVTLDAAPSSTWRAWVRIGAEHILGGLDHLAFVIGLLLVLGTRLDRRLLLSLTAFTVGHSLTLALAVLDVVRVSIAPVEACIAASVLLVAREAMHRQPTAVRRWPWLAAGGFGLIHGLGFASALGELPLPSSSLVPTLFWFNLGVELGQLAVVAAVVSLAWLARRALADRAWFHPAAHRTACYALGALGAWWLAERVVAIAA